MWRKLGAIFDRIIFVLNGMAATVIILVMVLICVHVVARYAFHSPIDWTVQMTEYSLLLIIALGSACLLKQEGHVSMDILLVQLKPHSRNLLNFITSIIGVMVCLVVVYYGTKTSVDLLQRGIPVLGEIAIPKSTLTIILTSGFFLLLIQFVRRMLGYFTSWRAK